MRKLSIIIVEDETLIAEGIKIYLEERGHEVLSNPISYEEAVSDIETKHADIILIDIRLYGEKSGIDLGKFIKTKYPNLPFVFLTSQLDENIMSEIFKLKPQGYLAKPISKETLWTTVELAVSNTLSDQTNPTKKIQLNDGEQVHHIDENDIQYIHSSHVYIKVFLSSQDPVLVRKSLAHMMKFLSDDKFIQCHRSFIINKNHVAKWSSNAIYIDEVEIPVSRSRKDQLNAFLKSSN